MNTTMLEQRTDSTVLIVEDEAGPRDALQIVLRPFCRIVTAGNSRTALEALAATPVDLVTLDLRLPGRSGLDLLKDIRAVRPEAEIIVITGYGSLQSAMDVFRLGAAAYLLKPFNVVELAELAQQTISKKRRLDVLRDFLVRSGGTLGAEAGAEEAWAGLFERHRSAVATPADEGARTGRFSEYAQLFAELMEARHRDLLAHSCRVSYYAALMGNHLTLSPSERIALTVGAFLHDVGIVAIPRESDASPGATEDWDAEPFAEHPELGARMVLATRLGAEIGQIVQYHHEWFDGSRSPHGLRGDGIPLLARIVAVLDAMDAGTADRIEPAAYQVEALFDRLSREGGRRFDPDVVESVAAAVKVAGPSLFEQAATTRKAAVPVS